MRWSSISSSILAAFMLLAAVPPPAEAQAAHPQFSPDGEQLAYFTFDLEAQTATLLVLDMQGGESRAVETGLAWSAHPSWSPDGAALYFTGADGMAGVWDLYRLNLASGAVSAVTATPEREMQGHVSPDGRRIVFIRMAGGPDVWLRDLENGEERQLTAGEDREFHPKFSGDGRSVLFDRSLAAGGSQVISLDLESGEETLRAGVSAGVPRRVSHPGAFGEAGWMYASNFDSRGGGWTARTEGVTRTFRPEDGSRIGAASQRPGHDQVALELDDGSGSRIVLYDWSEGRVIRTLAQ